MTNEDLAQHLQAGGFEVESINDSNGVPFLAIRGYRIGAGSLQGTVCDVALQQSASVPYAAPSAIHTRPALVPMDMSDPLKTQNSSLGPEWQYWSRTLRVPPTPAALLAHIATIFAEV